MELVSGSLHKGKGRQELHNADAWIIYLRQHAGNYQPQKQTIIWIGIC